jgi:hypothetical protein
MLFINYIIKLNLRNTKIRTHNLFQNNSSVQFSYTMLNIRKVSLRKVQEIKLTKNKDHCRASWQYLAGRIYPAGR